MLPATVPTHDRLLLRVEEAAVILGLGRSTMFELLASGAINSVSIGRARRVATSELARYVDSIANVCQYLSVGTPKRPSPLSADR